MAKKGISITHYNDGRLIGTSKNRTGTRLTDWIEVKYKKFRFDTGYSVMLGLPNGEDVWLQKNRIVLKRDKKKVYVRPDYHAEKFPQPEIQDESDT